MRDILHLFIPDFPIAVNRVVDPSLRCRPVAVAPGHSERALLQAVSAEGKTEGIHEGMSVYRARRFCPKLTLLAPDPPLLARASRALQELSARYSPAWEPVAAGRLFLDPTGCDRLFGPGRDVATRLEKEIAVRLRLTGTVGVAANKLVSRIAADYLRQPGVCDVLRGSETGFIAPLPVSVLPGLGQHRTTVLFHDLNLRRVEEVAALTVAQLRLAVGPFAPLLHQRALGVDPSPVQPPRRLPEIREESFLSREENDEDLLRAELCRMVEGCGLRLRQLGRGAGKLVLTLTYVDGLTERRAMLFPSPENRDMALLRSAEELFRRAGQRRVRLKALQLVGMQLALVSRQMELLSDGPDDREGEALQDALDRLRHRYGMAAIQRGRALLASRLRRSA